MSQGREIEYRKQIRHNASFSIVDFLTDDPRIKPNNNHEGKMHFEGTVKILAPREKVWNYLTNAEFVTQCAPGVKKMEVVVPNEKYYAVASVGFGSVVAVFKTDVEFQELKEPEFATVKAHGDAPGGSVDVTSAMSLFNGLDGTTELKWAADITVVGRIASVASRMMSSVTKKLTTNFFECVKQQIET
jgi:carbon monoxide dehydrogenase subunit G